MGFRTVIKGGWVVAWGVNGHEVLDGGIVMIEGNQIVYVGFPNDPNIPNADRVVYASGKLISPGLINLHCIANLDLQVLRIDKDVREGATPQPGTYLLDNSVPHILSDADFRTSADFSVATLLKSGNTSFCAVTTGATKRWEDPIEEPYALIDSSERMGARAWVSHLFREVCEYTDSNGASKSIRDHDKALIGLDHATDLIKHLQQKGNSRINGFLFPSRTDRCSDDLLQEIMRQSRLLGVHVRSHFAEYMSEYREFKSKPENIKRTMVEWLNDVGFLGPEVCLTHALYIAGHSATSDGPGEDLEILAQSGTSIGHCPVVFGRGGAVMQSFSRYIRSGVNVGLGTDTFPPDLIEEMRIGSLINKIVDGSRSAGTIKEFYNAATIGGARALGREDLGRLAAGCTADISIFNMPRLEVGPIDDPMRTFMHFCNARDCDMVIVDGQVVVEAGQVIGVDEEELGYKAQQTWDRYKSGMVSRDFFGRDTDSLFPPAFPVVRRQGI